MTRFSPTHTSFCKCCTSHFHCFNKRIFYLKVYCWQKGGRPAGTPWPRRSWKRVNHKIFSISPSSNIPSPVCSILRHRKTATCHFEGGGMGAGKRRGAEVTGRDLRLQRSAREMDLDPFQKQKQKNPFQFNFQMSFDGTGCFHWCVGRSAEECTLTRFLSINLPTLSMLSLALESCRNRRT